MNRAMLLTAAAAALVCTFGCRGGSSGNDGGPNGAATGAYSPAARTARPPASEPEAAIIGIIADQLGVERSRVTDRATLAELGADELDMVEIAAELQDRFGIAISDEDAAGLTTVGRIIDCVKSKLASAGRGEPPGPESRPDSPPARD